MRHLVTLSIGPVQDFIASARRTRDLWFGSHLLSEVSGAAARGLLDQGADLIFPALHGDRRLPDDVSNVILAELPDGSDPAGAVRHARKLCEAKWKQFASQTLDDASAIVERAIWDAQLDHVIEFQAAWVPLGDDYRGARARVARLLAGRKAIREFAAPHGVAGRPKSSLDGARETVFRDDRDDEAGKALKRRLRLTANEQLDSVGLVKRLGGGKQGYPSVSRIAADPWLRGVREHLGPLVAACRELEGKGMISLPRNGVFDSFLYEGSAVFSTRLKEIPDNPDDPGIREKMERIEKALRALTGKFGEPQPYFVVLVGDGDRMGRAISRIASAPDHQRFSAKMSEFAAAVRTIVEQHQGCLVYSGGDDVLALVSLDHGIECADALRARFMRTMEELGLTEPGDPTFSVGLAIGHFLEPLEDLLQHAREAEKDAKRERDSVAVHAHPRSGAPVKLCARWSEGMHARLLQFARMHCHDQFPDGAAYDLRQLALLYDGWPESAIDGLREDVMRLLSRKGREGHEAGLEEFRKVLERRVSNSADCRGLAEEVIVARRLADAYLQSGREPGSLEVPR